MRELGEEGLKQLVVVGGGLGVASLVVVASAVGTVRETNAAWLFNEDHVGNGVPRVWVVTQGEVLVWTEWAVLSEEAQKTGASRATVGPEGNRILGRIVAGLNEPIVHVLGLADVKVARELAEVDGQLLSSWEVGHLIGDGLRSVVCTHRGDC